MQTTEDEIDLFVWSASAADAFKAAQDEVAALNEKLQKQKQEFDDLNARLEDFIKAKEEHENVIFQKFCELLNSKKLKIRDQQRLLASAVVDPQAGMWGRVQCFNLRVNRLTRRNSETTAKHTGFPRCEDRREVAGISPDQKKGSRGR